MLNWPCVAVGHCLYTLWADIFKRSSSGPVGDINQLQTIARELSETYRTAGRAKCTYHTETYRIYPRDNAPPHQEGTSETGGKCKSHHIGTKWPPVHIELDWAIVSPGTRPMFLRLGLPSLHAPNRDTPSFTLMGPAKEGLAGETWTFDGRFTLIKNVELIE